MVAQTKNEIRDISGIRNSLELQLGRQKGGYGDPVFGSVQLRDKLFQKLQQQQALGHNLILPDAICILGK